MRNVAIGNRVLLRVQLHLAQCLILRVVENSHVMVHEQATKNDFIEAIGEVDARPVRRDYKATLAGLLVIYQERPRIHLQFLIAEFDFHINMIHLTLVILTVSIDGDVATSQCFVAIRII